MNSSQHEFQELPRPLVQLSVNCHEETNKILSENEHDHGPFINKLKRYYHWIYLHVVCVILSMVFFLSDIGMDAAVAFSHYKDGNTWFFILTVSFIAVPSIAVSVFSLWWYLSDANIVELPSVSRIRWIVRAIFLLLQMGPILRYMDSLYFGIKSYCSKSEDEAKIYKIQMKYETTDASLLRLFECFMESSPQLVLQIYIYAQSQVIFSDQHSVTGLYQAGSVFTSLTGVSWALTSYQRVSRRALEDKRNMTCLGQLVQFLWHFFDIASRVLALGLFASIFPRYFFMICGVHYVIMLMWIQMLKTDFFNNACLEFLYNAALSVIFLFCYFNPKDSPTRLRVTIYYAINFLENSILIYVWFNYCTPHIMYKLPVVFIQLACFIIGILLMITYYLYLHPTQNISLKDHWTNFQSIGFCSQGCNTISEENTVADKTLERGT